MCLRGAEYSSVMCPIACVLLECCLRFLEERKEIMEKFAKEQDAFLRDAQEKHSRELQLLQQGHQQQLRALRMELETKHHSELARQLASLESKQQVLLEAHGAELQVKHSAEMSALEKQHLSNLNALESCYLADVQTIRDEHRRALELLRAELEEQLQKKDSSHKEILAHELEKLKLKHAEELQSAKNSLRVQTDAKHTENVKALATDSRGAHQVRCRAPCCDSGQVFPLLMYGPHVICVWAFMDMNPCILFTHLNVSAHHVLCLLCLFVYMCKISLLARMCLCVVYVCICAYRLAVVIYGLTVDDREQLFRVVWGSCKH